MLREKILEGPPCQQGNDFSRCVWPVWQGLCNGCPAECTGWCLFAGNKSVNIFGSFVVKFMEETFESVKSELGVDLALGA